MIIVYAHYIADGGNIIGSTGGTGPVIDESGCIGGGVVSPVTGIYGTGESTRKIGLTIINVIRLN